jgi:hypothetical protein
MLKAQSGEHLRQPPAKQVEQYRNKKMEEIEEENDE